MAAGNKNIEAADQWIARALELVENQQRLVDRLRRDGNPNVAHAQQILDVMQSVLARLRHYRRQLKPD